ncbi:pyridoxamine 5'-phosphate oxidase family protein [Haloplanus litoreus]|uniref:pyridoxamine 5'-phosphate oxidase family protein n=1 Tax=Haloplanus litoreus TaxID=767515 RepID=UPI0036078848
MTIDDLTDYGMVRMDDGEIRALLSSHSVGVLGLPADGAPSLRPMSCGYDDEAEALYLLYIVGTGSRKAALSDRVTEARFLVYSVETQFNWRSALLTGRIDAVPEEETTAVGDRIEFPWQPDLFRRAGEAERTRLYRFDITEWEGLKHVGLPPAFEAPAEDESA